MENVYQKCSIEKFKSICKEKVEANGEKWASSYGQAFRTLMDIIDKEILDGRIEQIRLAECDVNAEAYRLDCERKDFNEKVETFEERKKQLDGRGDLITENAYKFAKKMGELYQQFPENVTEALSYTVYAYLMKADLFKELLTQELPSYELPYEYKKKGKRF